MCTDDFILKFNIPQALQTQRGSACTPWGNACPSIQPSIRVYPSACRYLLGPSALHPTHPRKARCWWIPIRGLRCGEPHAIRCGMGCGTAREGQLAGISIRTRKAETHALIPTRIREGNQITVRIQRLHLLYRLLGHLHHRLTRRLWFRSLWCRCRRSSLLGVEGANQEFRLVLLEDAIVVVFPELLAGVLASNAGEDLLAACAPISLVFGGDRDAGEGKIKYTWMLILELGQIVDVLVDDHIKVSGLVVGGNVGLREGLGHDGQQQSKGMLERRNGRLHDGRGAVAVRENISRMIRSRALSAQIVARALPSHVFPSADTPSSIHSEINGVWTTVAQKHSAAFSAPHAIRCDYAEVLTGWYFLRLACEMPPFVFVLPPMYDVRSQAHAEAFCAEVSGDHTRKTLSQRFPLSEFHLLSHARSGVLCSHDCVVGSTSLI